MFISGAKAFYSESNPVTLISLSEEMAFPDSLTWQIATAEVRMPL